MFLFLPKSPIKTHTTSNEIVRWPMPVHNRVKSPLHFTPVLVEGWKKFEISIRAPAKTSDILEQLHQDIDTRYYHETVRNDRDDTKSDDF